MEKTQPLPSVNNKEAARRFHRDFLWLIVFAWTFPPAVGYSFFSAFEIFTLEQAVNILLSPLLLGYIVSASAFVLFYFHAYFRPVTAWIQQQKSHNENIVQHRLKRFALHFWCFFIVYVSMGATLTIVGADIYEVRALTLIDMYRIYMMTLITAIITGLPIFFRLFDLFGRSLGGCLRLSRPLLTIRTRVFLIGALVPLLIDTILVQYFWTRTGFFGWETFAVWLVLELLAIAGSLLFLRSFKQSLGPLHGLFMPGGTGSLDGPGSVIPASTDELGSITARLSDLLDELYQQHEQLDEARKIMQKREQHLSLTLNSIGDAVIATDAEGRISHMNPVAEQLTGWSFDEAQGLAITTVLPIINASTRQPIENPVAKVLASGETVYLSNHTTLIAKDGTEYQIADSAAPIRNDGGVIQGVVLVFNDVTEQYRLREAAGKSERDLQAIMDNSPAVIYVKDIEGKHIFINREYEKVLKTSRIDIIGKADHDIFPVDIADELQRNDKAVLAAGQAIESEETVPLADGVHHYLSVKFPLFDENNKMYAVCGISTDITERKKQEEQLRRSQKMDALGKLTGGVAHDYNNLLGIISGYAELLDESLGSDPGLAKYARDIRHAAERGARLTQKLLAFSKLKTSDNELVDINALLLEQRLMLEKSLTASVRLTFDLADDLWPVCLDSGDLEDAIVNISINAMYAMKAAGTLTIQTRNVQIHERDARAMSLASGEYALLNITDTGCGMDDATIEKIFDPFFSTKGTRGTGLGLSQVYSFVERSGGTIKVYSEPGQGTCFSLYFPRSQKSRSKDKATSDRSTSNLQGKETLLVVDDEQDMLELAQAILTRQGYRVLTASDGEQALKVLQKEAVDFILSDVIMPNMDGYQLAARVHQSYPHIKILMTSGFTDDRHNKITDEMLHKPYRSKALLERVRSLLDEGDEKDTLVGRTVLVVDDEEDVRDLFKLKLEKLGCKILLAGNGNDAIALYRQALQSDTPIDAVILDLGFPGSMSGKEIADKIHAMDSLARIIVASGHTEGPEMTRYADYGFSGALEKNFDQEKIRQVLEQVLSS